MKKTDFALVFVNGDKPPIEQIRAFWGRAKLKVCADGAFNYLHRHKLEPDVLIGDFDSVDPVKLDEIQHTQIKIYEDQDTTDSEKAILYCRSKGFRKVVLLGALGKRLDHQIYNLSLLAGFLKKGVKVVAVNRDDVGFCFRNQLALKAQKGQRISLIPLFGKVEVVKSKGFAFSVEEMRLEMGKSISQSNRFGDHEIELRIQKNPLLVLIENQSKRSPVFLVDQIFS